MAVRARELQQAIDKVANAIAGARWAFETPFSPPDLERDHEEFRTLIERTFDVLAMEDRHSTEGLRRAIQHLPPAGEAGTEARDAAIWVAVLEDHRRRSEAGFWVSANRKHFAAKAGTELHPKLAEEATSHSHPLVWVDSVADVLARLAEADEPWVGLEEIRGSFELKVMAQASAVRTPLPPLQELVMAAFGMPPGPVTYTTIFRGINLHQLVSEYAYRLIDGTQVSVINTEWLVEWSVEAYRPEQIDGPIVEPAYVVVPLQIWARREPSSSEITWEVSAVGESQIGSPPTSGVPIVTSSRRRTIPTVRSRPRIFQPPPDSQTPPQITRSPPRQPRTRSFNPPPGS